MRHQNNGLNRYRGNQNGKHRLIVGVGLGKCPRKRAILFSGMLRQLTDHFQPRDPAGQHRQNQGQTDDVAAPDVVPDTGQDRGRRRRGQPHQLTIRKDSQRQQTDQNIDRNADQKSDHRCHSDLAALLGTARHDRCSLNPAEHPQCNHHRGQRLLRYAAQIQIVHGWHHHVGLHVSREFLPAEVAH